MTQSAGQGFAVRVSELGGGNGQEESRDVAQRTDSTELGRDRVGGQSPVGEGGDGAERACGSLGEGVGFYARSQFFCGHGLWGCYLPTSCFPAQPLLSRGSLQPPGAPCQEEETLRVAPQHPQCTDAQRADKAGARYGVRATQP